MSNFGTVRGTIANLVATATVNGRRMNAPQLSMLTSLGEGTFAQKVAVAPKVAGTRGRAAAVWELSSNESFKFED